MAYNETTGVLTIDSANETFDEILDNTARALNDYRVTEVAGVLARDVGMLCTSPNVNKWSKRKPVRYNSFSDITENNLKEVNYGFLPVSMPDSIFTSYIDAITSVGSPLTQFPQIDKWSYLPPRGLNGSYNEPYRLNDFKNYNTKAKTFLGSKITYTLDLSTPNYNGGYYLPFMPSYNYDGKSINWSGSSDEVSKIDILLTDLNLKVLDSNMHNIGDAEDPNKETSWRIAVGIYCGGRWLIVSSEKPLTDLTGKTTLDEILPYKVNLGTDYILRYLKKYARLNGISSFKCAPFLAYDLKYTSEKGWYWGNTTIQKALTFPNGDVFNLGIEGFPTKVIVSQIVPTITINGSVISPSTMVQGTDANGNTVGRLVYRVPSTITSFKLSIKVTFSDWFGYMSNVVLGCIDQASVSDMNTDKSEGKDGYLSYTHEVILPQAASGLTQAFNTGGMSSVTSDLIFTCTNSELQGTQDLSIVNGIRLGFIFSKL